MTNVRMGGVALMKGKKRKRMLALGIITSMVLVMFASYISEGIIAKAEENQMLIGELIAEREEASLNDDGNKVREINEQLRKLGLTEE